MWARLMMIFPNLDQIVDKINQSVENQSYIDPTLIFVHYKVDLPKIWWRWCLSGAEQSDCCPTGSWINATFWICWESRCFCSNWLWEVKIKPCLNRFYQYWLLNYWTGVPFCYHNRTFHKRRIHAYFFDIHNWSTTLNKFTWNSEVAKLEQSKINLCSPHSLSNKCYFCNLSEKLELLIQPALRNLIRTF